MRRCLVMIFFAGLHCWQAVGCAADQTEFFAIQVLDEATGRGVPLVELETINHLRFVTDSRGWIAIGEPDLLGRKVYFTVRSHGYEYPADGFGFRGKSFDLVPGGRAILTVKRLNLAERLYRVTGSGIYRDSTLLGEATPLRKPLLNGEVFGCDSVMATTYQGKIFWFWGDTSRPHYPIGGNFHISGATSRLPQQGGLAPSEGVDFDYFSGESGAVRPLAKMPGDGPTWISSVTVLKDANDREGLYAAYVKIRNQLEAYCWGFVKWNDDQQHFEQLRQFKVRPTNFIEPQGHTFIREENGSRYVYFANPFPLVRVVATPEAFLDPQQYEGFTCLQVGTAIEDQQLDRDTSGTLRYSWKVGTPPLSPKEQQQLVNAGVLAPSERRFVLHDVESGQEVQAHNGSVYWNEFRKRWVLITVELKGNSSLLGELWFAEADEPTGPWAYARKIVTHDNYSFYNPKHHPFFDQEGGRVIYLEGTYTQTFSGNPVPTPRYDYNQIMYRLDLAIDELNLPVAFYRTEGSTAAEPFGSQPRTHSEIAFFAKQRPSPETVPVVWNGTQLEIGSSDSDQPPLFYALPADASQLGRHMTPLYVFTHATTGEQNYGTSTSDFSPDDHFRSKPICTVWLLPTQITEPEHEVLAR